MKKKSSLNQIFKKVYSAAFAYDAKLRADDKRFDRCVHIVHQDGSTLFFDSAFLMKVDVFIVVFTEHHGARVYHSEDLEWSAQFERIHGPIEKLRIK